MMEINGVINFYKEKGQTSFKAVHQLKKILNVSKIGHTGTLDPLAQGVLPVCIGKATRTSMYIMDSTKEYLCTMKLGFETDTLDLEGTVTKKDGKKEFNETEIKECLDSFKGESEQMPPVYSAIKVKGMKLYQYARNNMEVEISPRKIHIFKISLISHQNDEIVYKVSCEKGTYIRSLCRDIAHELGTFGTMTDLIRLKTGKFSIENSFRLDDVEAHVRNGTILSIVENPDDYMKLGIIDLNEADSSRYLKGIKILSDAEEGEYLVRDSDKRTLGIGIICREGMLKSKKRLF